LIVDDDRHVATFDDHPVALTPVEFRLLKALAAEPGQIVSRAKLLAQLYTDHRVVTDRTVDSHVKNVRRKLANVAAGADLIRSIYGVGYKLEI
jgi:two-component system, OmpR family, response regulator BaeR